MPFAFIIVGIVMLISGVRGKSANLLTLLKGDLTGSNNFVYWILSILVIGSLGYVDEFKTLSRALLGLVLVVLILADDKNGSGGFFATLQSDLKQLGASGGTSVASISSPSATGVTQNGDGSITVPDVFGGTTYPAGTKMYSLSNQDIQNALSSTTFVPN